MPINYKQNCPKCGHMENSRIPREGYMRLIPGSKYYQCVNCGTEFLVNSWVIVPFVLIFYLIQFIFWIVWDFSSLRFFWESIYPPADSSYTKRRPSTFLIKFAVSIVLYLILFGIAQQGYNNRIAMIENKTNIILSRLSIPNDTIRKYTIDMIPTFQEMLSYDEPSVYNPHSVIGYFFQTQMQSHNADIEILKSTIGYLKDELDPVAVSKANRPDAR